MRVKENYLNRIEEYFNFRGNRDDTLKLVEEFYLYLKTNFPKNSTRSINWHALVDYYKSNVIGKTIPMENWVKEIAWIKYIYGYRHNTDSTPI